jgi:hypothetical protein
MDLIDTILNEVQMTSPPQKGFQNILDFAQKEFASAIWDTFRNMNFERDIQEAITWLKTSFQLSDKFTGIYLGLDTLNMNEGTGYNIEIGLSSICNPAILEDSWLYECEVYGENHLIRSLYEVEDSFSNEEKWNNKERSKAEYTIFLAYSGLVLREALQNTEIKQDFLAMWGFHDGDIFYLMQQKNRQKIMCNNILES